MGRSASVTDCCNTTRRRDGWELQNIHLQRKRWSGSCAGDRDFDAVHPGVDYRDFLFYKKTLEHHGTYAVMTVYPSDPS